MNTTTLKLGMGQMLVEGGAVGPNLERARQMIWRAANEGCQIVVLPECLDLGWTFPEARRLAQPIPGAHSDALVQAAEEARIYVAAGLTEKAEDVVYNAALLLSPEGKILLKHRKINELDIAWDLYSIGDSLAVAKTLIGTIAVDICADNFPDSLALGHSLARMGSQILLSPCAWAVDGGHDNQKQPYGDLWKRSYTTLARLYDMPVVGVSSVGRIDAGAWKGRKCIGCSLAVGSGGEILAQGPYGENAESLIVVEVQMSHRSAKGTAIAELLRSKGYTGP